MEQLQALLEQRYGDGTGTHHDVELNQTLRNILSRRSVRSFREDTVPEALLQTLFATAFSAPSKSDLQQACVINVSDPDQRTRIAGLHGNTDWLARAPVFMVWCGDSRRIRRLCEWRGHAFANDHLDAFMNAAVDVAIVMQTFIVAAESVGLGCCPVSEVRNRIVALSEILALPKWVFPVAGLCVGWADRQPPLSMRLPLQVTVHDNRYDDTGLFETVSAYDAHRESREQTPPEKQRMVERYGVSDTYGWSENRTRQYSVAARADFGEYIRAQGFDLS
ncbi:MAG: nitroreductase family protein [Gammaproteobacteria bacterium]|nr:nitroreductase family protein [Gammaproteobacteria bacterium]